VSVHRTTIALGGEAHDYLLDYQRRKDCSQGEAFRRALGIMKFVEEVQGAPGDQMLAERGGVLRAVVFLV
jgi:hypothetical protein